MPARIMLRITSGKFKAGPSVATIIVIRLRRERIMRPVVLSVIGVNAGLNQLFGRDGVIFR